MASTPERRQHDGNESAPVFAQATRQRADFVESRAQMWQRERAEDDHDGSREHGDYHRQRAGVFGSQKIERANGRDGCCRENFGVRRAEILEGGQRRDSRRDDVIGDKQKRADDGNDFRAVANAGVHAASVRIMFADDDVVQSHQPGEHAHRRNQPEGGIASYREGETDDVCFACPPVSVEDGGGPRGVNVARSAGFVTYDHDLTCVVRFPAGEDGTVSPLSE